MGTLELRVEDNIVLLNFVSADAGNRFHDANSA